MLTFIAAVTLSSATASGAPQTWTGQISDAMCKNNHAMMQKGSTKLSEKECTAACVKAGQKYVLLSGDKVLKISNQNFAGLSANAGGSVKVTGEPSADGNSITVSKVEPLK